MNKLVIENLSYEYEENKPVLKDVNIEFNSNNSYAIIGKSGSGKTTLISLLSGLDRYNQGDIKYNDQSLNKINLDKYRSTECGLIFQSYNLLNNYTVLDNILIAMKLSSQLPDEKVVESLLEQVGLDASMINKYPGELSGGQQQRVAIARTLAKKPNILIADEPTGNLDEQTEVEIINLLKKIAKEDGVCLIIVTHSNYVANNCDVVLGINNGELNHIKGQ